MEEVIRDVHLFSFNFPHITENKATVTHDEAEKWKEGMTPIRPAQEAMLLVDYFTNPEAEWQSVSEWHRNANGYLFRPEDADRIKESEWFTASVALARLKNKSPLSSRADSDIRHEDRRSAKADKSKERPPKSENPEKQNNVWMWIAGMIAILMAGIAFAKKSSQ